MKRIIPLTVSILLYILGYCDPGNDKIFSCEHNSADLSALKWHLWLDEKAEWVNDELFLPPVDITKLPANPPTCGWDSLINKGITVNIPATVEEYYWGYKGNTYGVSGNYKGVSWFTTEIKINSKDEFKIITLDFESVNGRAEVYVNNKLAGYDLINGTPFTVDISSFVNYDAKNVIAVRITDAYGNFDWRDYKPLKWGKYIVPTDHGFGGITGKIYLRTMDMTYIKDVYIKNKPVYNEIDLEVTMGSIASLVDDGKMNIKIYEYKEPQNVVWENTYDVNAVNEGNIEKLLKHTIQVKDAKLWSVEEPNLYYVELNWTGTNNTRHDRVVKRFGFRWFEVKDVDSDRQFFLNGKRMVLVSAISWGFWPVNGIYPSDSMAIKQIQTAKSLGLNMLNFHRQIGQTNVLDYADELGLLYYEEPGGYSTNDPFLEAWSREKLLRMIKRDRNHPSLIIYDMKNEVMKDPTDADKKILQEAHRLDETRIITFSSNTFTNTFYNEKCPKEPAECKAYMEPYDQTFKIQGWWDEHHNKSHGVYVDEHYVNSKDYYLYTDNKSEIIFYGEEGAIGMPPNLELIKQQIQKSGKKGWDGDDYLRQYNAYNSFLDAKGLKKAFPDVKSLTESLSNVAYYYQGRIIENVRINNINDGYVINGWECEKVENHSGIVDTYRNPKGDINLIKYYNQPLYLAVKAKNKVIETNDTVNFDIYIVNEKNINGNYDLEVNASDENNKTVFSKTYQVNITGGNTYGQLLIENIIFKNTDAGYSTITAVLKKQGNIICKGEEKIFSVSLDNKVTIPIAIIDSADITKNILLSADPQIQIKEYEANKLPKEKVLVVGNMPLMIKDSRGVGVQTNLIDWVMEGNSLIIIKDADLWAKYLQKRELVNYKGYENVNNIAWFGGNYFVREHPLFKQLPVNCAFNWEYQSIASYKRNRIGLRLDNEECIVGAQIEHKQELFTAVSVIRVGKGKIILSALDIEGAINSGLKSSVVARKILLNYIQYCSEKE